MNEFENLRMSGLKLEAADPLQTGIRSNLQIIR
jgi:hypothetical protein